MQLKMSKVEIVGLKNLFFEAIDSIQEMGTLHVEDLSKKMGPKYANVVPMELDPKIDEERVKLQNLLLRVKAMLSELTAPDEKIDKQDLKNKYSGYSKYDLEEIDELVDSEEEKVRDIINRKNELEVELSRLSKYEPIIRKIEPLAQQVTVSEHYASVAIIVDKKFRAVIKYIEEELDKITNKQCDVITADVDEDTTAALIVYKKQFSDEVHNFLAAENVNQVRLPGDMANKPYDEVLKEIRQKKEKIPPELDKAKQKLHEVSVKWYASLLALKQYLSDRLDALDAIPKFGQSGHVFVVTGWVPSEKVDEMRDMLEEKFEGKVDLTELKPTHQEIEEAPVAIQNKPIARPFEFIYKLMKPPKYGRIDPTFIVAIFFPLLYGFIVGDAGYGIIVCSLAVLLRTILKKKGKEAPFLNLFAGVLWISGISAMFFGILYFEAFGDLLFRIVGWPHGHVAWVWGYTANGMPWGWPLERLASHNKDMFEILLLTVLSIGVLHMSVALVVGVLDGIREGDKKHTYEKLGVLLFILGLVAIFGTMWGIKSLSGVGMGVGLVMIIVGVVMAAYGNGFGGALEAVLSFGHILSYARLYAIGLASVILADVANALGAEFGGEWYLLPIGVIVAAIFHTLNICLAILSPSIHSMRLNLVEAFTKFYSEGDTVYEPFKKAGTN